MTLVIGGPMNGERVSVPEHVNEFKVAINTDMSTVTYRKEMISCGSTDFFVFIPQAWDCTDLFEALLEGYKEHD